MASDASEGLTVSLSTATALPVVPTGAGGLPALYAPDPRATRRVAEFFTAHIRNRHTLKGYAKATAGVAAWCDAHGVGYLRDIEPVHVAAHVEDLQLRVAAPSVKLRLAGILRLFDWLVVGQIIPTNLASAVHGPKHSVKTTGKIVNAGQGALPFTKDPMRRASSRVTGSNAAYSILCQRRSK